MQSVVGVIGSGNIGKDVAGLVTTAGLRAVLANSRGPESLTVEVAELGPRATADTVEGTVRRADIVVLALPIAAVPALGVIDFEGKVVVDATNYNPSMFGPVPELDSSGSTSSEFVAGLLPSARVVKGLNNVDFVRLPRLAEPAGSARRSALPIAGDDRDAKQEVVALLNAIGFDALDLGALTEGRRTQPGTPLYVAPYLRHLEPLSEDPYQRFMDADTVPVPAELARELAEQA